MSWKFGGILIKDAEEDRIFPAFFKSPARETGTIKLNEALKTTFTACAIGNIGNALMIIDHVLPYDSRHGFEQLGPLDEKIAGLSGQGKALCFFLDGVSGTYGFSYFLEGTKTWSMRAVPGQDQLEYGGPPKGGTFTEAEDHEEFLFSLIDDFLDEPMEDLIFDKSAQLRVYERE